MIGRTVGKYRIVGQLGRGGAGVVYKAVDETLHRDVAVKTLNPDLANTEVMARFRAEATILARLNHPQIATIYELFKSDDELLMVMEFVRGEALDKLVERQGALAPERAAYLIGLILSALEHAHRAGVVHRDVKPANVMVTDEGSLKIMDFGIARVLGAEQKTIDFRLMGTPAYMSPEQVLGEEVDGRSDLYSVGVLLYRLLTGALPFSADTALSMLQRQIRDTPIPLCAFRGGLPAWCQAIVDRALAKSPADRFQSAEEFRAALLQATGPLPAADLAKTFSTSAQADAVQAPPMTETVALSGVESQARAASVEESRRPPRSARLAWASAAAVLVFVAVVLAYGMLREDTTEGAIAVSPAADLETPPAAPVSSLPPVDSVTIASRGDVRALESTRDVELVLEAPAPQGRVTARPAATPAPAPIATVTEPVEPAPLIEPIESPARRLVRAPGVEPKPTLVFETKTLVGTRKPKEQGAQLVLGDEKITLFPTSDPASPLCSFPYSRVLSINVSHGRDPLWNSPAGPAPVARAGGALSRFGIKVERDWIALRTSTDEQLVAMRFDKVLLKRVLLALEERTGHQPQFIELRKDKD